MPDLNQSNPYLSNYLIQNTLWWIEFTGLDGIREDTYPYVNQKFLSKWAETIFEEYPTFNIVGEVWIHDPVFLAPFQTGNKISNKIDTNLPSVTDFGLFEAFSKVFNRGESIYNIYNFVSRDFLYSEPNMLLTFLDNHDVWRLWDLVDENIERYKLALTILLTTRGIPQIYYGTEIGIKGGDDHGLIRRDFPGGFPGDERNVFNRNERNAKESEIFNYLKSLLKIRKRYNALSIGKLIHLPPKDEIYCYIRQYESEKIMVLINNNEKTVKINIDNYSRFLFSTNKLENLITGKTFLYNENTYIDLEKNNASIFLLK